MAKPFRNPLLGYNHNVKYGGKIFHVQTEDSGPANPHLFTHLFFEGSIVASKRLHYDPVAPDEEVRALMQSQHKAILKELKQAQYNERIARFFEMRGEVFPTEEFFPDTPPAVASTDPAPVMANPVAELPDPDTEPAAVPEVLDLDAIASNPGRQRTPEPLPVHHKTPVVPGPGSYTFRRPTQDRIPIHPQHPGRPPTPVSNPTTKTPSHPGAARGAASRPEASVHVQRHVMVGQNATSPTPTRKASSTPVKRRPTQVGPFVVAEGSHPNIIQEPRRPASAPSPEAQHRLGPPTVPMDKTPRTYSPPPTPSTRPESIPIPAATEQSLDDAILAYLSQGEGKR